MSDRSELEAYRKDALRYRWLRERSGTMKIGDPGEDGYKHFVMAGEFEPFIDEAIDEAIRAAAAMKGET